MSYSLNLEVIQPYARSNWQSVDITTAKWHLQSWSLSSPHRNRCPHYTSHQHGCMNRCWSADLSGSATSATRAKWTAFYSEMSPIHGTVKRLYKRLLFHDQQTLLMGVSHLQITKKKQHPSAQKRNTDCPLSPTHLVLNIWLCTVKMADLLRFQARWF